MNEKEQREFLETLAEFKKMFESFASSKDSDLLVMYSETISYLNKLIMNLDNRLRKTEKKLS